MSFKETLITKIKAVVLRSDIIVFNTNKQLLIAGLGFIGLAIIGSYFIQAIDPQQIPVGFTD